MFIVGQRKPQVTGVGLVGKTGILKVDGTVVGSSTVESHYYDEYTKTFCDSRVENIWNSFLLMCDLFKHYAKEVSTINGFEYKASEEENMSAYINKHYTEYVTTVID